MLINLAPSDISAIFLSIKVALLATLISAPFGFAAAYFLVFSRFPAKTIFEGFINLPLVLPPVVVGYLLLLFFGKNGWGGSILGLFNISVVFTLKAAVIASTIVGFPLLVRSIRIGMENIDTTYVKASRTLGAGWWDSLFTIIFPLAGRSLIAGMTLMFARSLGEFGATIIIAGNIPGVTQTIPLAIYDYSNSPDGDKMALTLCVISVVISFTVLILSDRLTHVGQKKDVA